MLGEAEMGNVSGAMKPPVIRWQLQRVIWMLQLAVCMGRDLPCISCFFWAPRGMFASIFAQFFFHSFGCFHTFNPVVIERKAVEVIHVSRHCGSLLLPEWVAIPC